MKRIALLTENPVEYSISSKIIEALKKVYSFELIQVKEKRFLSYLSAENIDLRGFDIIISLGDKLSYSVLTTPDSKHIHYSLNINPCWESIDRIKPYNKRKISLFMSAYLSYLRVWDRLAADRVDYFISSSKNTRNKLKKYYRVNSEVIYPPLEVNRFKKLHNEVIKDNNEYLYVGSLYPYKKIEEIIKAFNKMGYKLRIVGKGEESYVKYLQSIAKYNIIFSPLITDDELSLMLKSCIALIYTEDESYATVVVEVQAAGKPAFVYKHSSGYDLVIDKVTGLVFNEIQSGFIEKSIKESRKLKFDPALCVNNSFIYNSNNFIDSFSSFMDKLK